MRPCSSGDVWLVHWVVRTGLGEPTAQAGIVDTELLFT